MSGSSRGRVIPVGRFIEAELQPVKQVRLRHNIVMLRCVTRVACIIGNEYAVNFGQLIRLRATGFTGIKTPQLETRRAVLFIAQSTFLNIFGLAIFQIGTIQGTAGSITWLKSHPSTTLSMLLPYSG